MNVYTTRVMPRLLLFIELLTRDRTVNCGMQSTAATELTAAARAASVTAHRSNDLEL